MSKNDSTTEALDDSLEKNGEAFPTVIFGQDLATPLDRTALETAFEAVKNAGLPVAISFTDDESIGVTVAEVRSQTTDRFEKRFESVLFQGAAGVSLGVLESYGSAKNALEKESIDNVAQVTEAAVRQVTDDPEMLQAFKGFYSGGIRLERDLNSMVTGIFAALPFDPKFVKENFNYINIINLNYSLDEDSASLERMDAMRKKSLAKIFKQTPELDYRKLDDPDYAQTEWGQKLMAAYSKQAAEVRADRYRRDYTIRLDSSMPKPIIPLSEFPLVEALMADQMTPSALRNYSTNEVLTIVLDSDSTKAQDALVTSLTSHWPSVKERFSDVLEDGEIKKRAVTSILKRYEEPANADQKLISKEQLIAVLEAYTADGTLGGGKLSETISGVLLTGLSSNEPDAFVRYIDTSPLSQNEKKLLVLDATEHSKRGAEPAFFQAFANDVFDDDSIAGRIAEIATLRQQYLEFMGSPEVHEARRAWRHSSISIDETPEKLAFDEATAPGNVIYEQVRAKLNELLLDEMDKILTKSDDLNGNEHHTAEGRLLKELLDRVYFRTDSDGLPVEYGRLLEFAERSDTPDWVKSRIMWHFSEKLKYTEDDSRYQLVQVVLDGYRVMLGPIDALRVPNGHTRHGLSAISQLASSNNIFKFASADQISDLVAHTRSLNEVMDRMLNGAIASGQSVYDEAGERKDQREIIEDFQDVARVLAEISGQYEKYLYLEDVKVKPHVYYPWVRDQMAQFWGKLQWEVGPGNRPSKAHLDLHKVFKHHIDNLLVYKPEGEDYPEDFDVIEDGHLGTLLREGYHRMIVTSDLQYTSSAVWLDGRAFVSYAARMMPPSVVAQIREQFPDDAAFLKFIGNGSGKDDK